MLVVIQTLRAFRRPQLGCLEAWRAEWLRWINAWEYLSKILIFEFPNPQKSSFGEVLKAILRSSEVSWVVLACLGRVWGVPWVRSGVPEGVLEASWGHFKASWGHFGMSWEDFGGD